MKALTSIRKIKKYHFIFVTHLNKKNKSGTLTSRVSVDESALSEQTGACEAVRGHNPHIFVNLRAGSPEWGI